MSSRELSVWINERWYNALSKHLKDETLEEHLENVLDEMCNQLPRQEYERISTLIWQEEQRNKEAAEAGRRFAVFHVTENGESVYFLVEERLEMLQTAMRLRSYLRKPPEDSPTRFPGMFTRGERISAEQFDTYVKERLDNTGRVVGAFDINLDSGTFDGLHIMDGWQRFRIQHRRLLRYQEKVRTAGVSMEGVPEPAGWKAARHRNRNAVPPRSAGIELWRYLFLR